VIGDKSTVLFGVVGVIGDATFLPDDSPRIDPLYRRRNIPFTADRHWIT
jgi:hypothetical protein